MNTANNTKLFFFFFFLGDAGEENSFDAATFHRPSPTPSTPHMPQLKLKSPALRLLPARHLSVAPLSWVPMTPQAEMYDWATEYRRCLHSAQAEFLSTHNQQLYSIVSVKLSSIYRGWGHSQLCSLISPLLLSLCQNKWLQVRLYHQMNNGWSLKMSIAPPIAGYALNPFSDWPAAPVSSCRFHQTLPYLGLILGLRTFTSVPILSRS